MTCPPHIRVPFARVPKFNRLHVLTGSVATCVLGMGAPLSMAQQRMPESSTVADARIQSLDRATVEQERRRSLVDSAPQGYEDRFMSPAEAGPLGAGEDGTEPPADSPGYRGWLLESRVGFGESSGTGFGRSRAAEFGLRAEYRRETLNYGQFILQADSRHLDGDNVGLVGIGGLGYARERSSGRFTLRNLGLPVTTHTFADTAVGDIYSELTDGLSRNYRLSLGTATVRGLSTRLYGADFDLRAGHGQRGYLAGGPYPGFEKGQGTISWLGLTKRFDEGRWFVAAQLDQARNVPAYYEGPFTSQGFGFKNVSSWAAALGYGPSLLRDGDFRLRATAIGSQVSSTTPGVRVGSAHGLFVEASTQWGRARHEFGAYTAQPQLHFGDYPLATGTRGAYWRMDQSTSRLNWGLGLDHERAAPEPAFGGVVFPGYQRSGVSANLQYLFDRHTSAGVSSSVYRTLYQGQGGSWHDEQSDSRSLYASAYYQTSFFGWPRTRFSATVRRNERIVRNAETATGQELQWEQEWIGGRYETLRPELTTTLGFARDQSGGTTRHYPTAGLQFRYWVDSGFSLTGNLRYTSQSGGLYTSRGLSGTLNAEKDLGRGWRLGFAASLNQARASMLPVQQPGPSLYRSNDKTVQVYLRWEGSAGSAYRSAGVRTNDAGTGSGGVAGQVFLDANRDGIQQVGEVGAANVEVLLDGRDRTTTDRDGRFEFPLVPTGRHQLTLQLESVPLPWGAAPNESDGVRIDVPLRGQANARIALVQVGP
ncbi:hypothetical protein VCH24_64030 [Variovorax boronicumulans]|nr:hypothetical protein VCH24_64030 [Variovorax boronicumulans]